MNILVIGGGGREHALAWKLKQSPRVDAVIVAPGNAGTAGECKVRNAEVAADDLDGLLKLAAEERIDLTVVGPEVPLVAGVVDRFRAVGRRIFGPSAQAAQLEGSKAFAKDFMQRHHIPTARYAVFTELNAAWEYVLQHGAPIVIKADGLAAGKGVVVALTLAEAQCALDKIFAVNSLGDSTVRVVIEEFLDGEEASYMVMSDGYHALPLASSQDHKRRDAGDKGPNTGGMGAYSPAPVITPEVEQRIMMEIIQPTLRAMADEGVPFIGVLYAGVMIDRQGQLKVIEFNVRLGDPEAQAVMLRLNTDLVDLVDAALDDQLQHVSVEWDRRPAVGVVLAAGGYPGKVTTGHVIDGLGGWGPVGKVFHAGTKRTAQACVATAGGRVLTVCALGSTIADARERAYAMTQKIHFEGMFYRHDIAYHALGYRQ